MEISLMMAEANAEIDQMEQRRMPINIVELEHRFIERLAEANRFIVYLNGEKRGYPAAPSSELRTALAHVANNAKWLDE